MKKPTQSFQVGRYLTKDKNDEQVSSNDQDGVNRYMSNQTVHFQSSMHAQTQKQQQNYRTSITQLISYPVEQNPYSMENVYQSIYQLSAYLWNKRFSMKYGQSGENNEQSGLDNSSQMSFDEYLLPIQEELNKYDRFRKNKARQEQKIYGLLNGQQLYRQQKEHQGQKKYHHSCQTTSHQQHKPTYYIPSAHSLQSQLIKCYQQVPFIFFEDNFSLDFAKFYDMENRQKYNNTQKMKQEQEKMNDNLDLIEINLFGQIHRKFEDYFKAAANFDYLKESIDLQLLKLSHARNRVSKVQTEFVEKSQRLRKKIVQRGNFQKLIKKLKIIKSLKKLPSIVEAILQSSLPYECLQLLKTTKKSISQVGEIQCVSTILSNIKSSQTIVQLGLNKRYTDQLYLYIEETFRSIDFVDQFKKLTRDCAVMDDKENKSTINNLSRRSESGFHQSSFRANDRSGFFVLDQLGESKGDNFAGKPLLKNTFAKRQEAKEYEIAMILLQSYEYVDFPVDVTKIKISNGLRVICRKFQKDLVAHIRTELQKNVPTHSSTLVLNELSPTQESLTTLPLSKKGDKVRNRDQQDSAQKQRQEIDRVSVQFYTKQIRVLNELFKQCINRYLGYVLTLITEYEQKLLKEITEIDRSSSPTRGTARSLQGSDRQMVQQSEGSVDELSLSKARSLQKSQRMSKMEATYTRFKEIFAEQLSVLPSMFKIIQEKVKYFMTLKNMSNATPQQFFQWVSLIRFWQRWFDALGQDSLVLNYTCNYLTSTAEISSSTQLLALGQDMINELVTVVVNNIKKSMTTMNLKHFITDLTVSYLNSYALQSNVNAELYQAIQDQSWQSVQIPQQFADVLNGILNKGSQNQNMSITILNSSSSQMCTSFNSSAIGRSINGSSPQRFKYKILKNNILLQGQRYKVTLSFLLLCEFLQELVRVGRLFEGITGQTDQDSLRQSKYVKSIQSHLYSKIYELIDYFNTTAKQMILDKKALKLDKIKGNNITVKHICLLSNCLTFLEKLAQQIPQKQLLAIFNTKQQQIQILRALTNRNILLIDKISSILNKKMEQLVAAFKCKQTQKTFSLVNLHQFVVQRNQEISKLFIQITQIIDEYLDIEKCEYVLKLPFQLFVQKYFRAIIMKGDKFVEEARILLQNMKFLKKYFKTEFLAMQTEIQQ